MISNESKTRAKFHSADLSRFSDHLICAHCGGNGYLKSNPNCYHTCLDCLGRGAICLETTR